MNETLLVMVHRANVSLKKSDDHCVTAAVSHLGFSILKKLKKVA